MLRALRLAKPNRRYKLANLVQILLQQSLAFTIQCELYSYLRIAVLQPVLNVLFQRQLDLLHRQRDWHTARLVADVYPHNDAGEARAEKLRPGLCGVCSELKNAQIHCQEGGNGI
jgi:hypothetical protein